MANMPVTQAFFNYSILMAMGYGYPLFNSSATAEKILETHIKTHINSQSKSPDSQKGPEGRLVTRT